MSSPGPPALQRLHCLRRSSSGFHDQLGDFLDGEEYRECVPKLQDDESVWLANYLDSALDALDPSSPAFRKSLRELRSICGTSATIPTSYTISSPLLTVEPEPFASGGFGDVYHGTLNDSKVCVKRVRVYSGDDSQKATKIFYHEAVMWKRLSHPNVLPLLGITTTPLRFISNLIPGGDLLEYIKNNPNTDRFGLLSDIAKGLSYLHSCNVIHGDLKGPNVLVDGTGRACITDFGLATVTQNLDSARSGTVQRGHSARWTAPEVLEGGKLSKEADIFSFAMVMVEVFTGAVPFSGLQSVAAMLAVVQCKRPPRPPHSTFTDDLWTVMQSCWGHDPDSRPAISEVVMQFLTLSVCNRLINHPLANPLTANERASLIATIIWDNDQVKAVDQVSEDDAQALIDAIDEVLDDGLLPEIRGKCLRYLYKVCGHRALLPRSLKIPLCYDANENPLRHDEFGDVWRGRHNGKDVSAKVLRISSTSDLKRTTKRFCKEVVGRKSLNHPNVLPLLGVTMTTNRFVMVSEWMENRNIKEFVMTHTDVDRVELLKDATKGLIYMHDQGMIHGNLQVANVLIDNDGHARLANFGLLTIISDEPTITSTAVGASVAHWMSPELLAPEKLGLEESHPTKASDCYALGMMVYEVLSEQTPFNQYPFLAVVMKVLEGERPERPQGEQGARFTDSIWETLELCWKPLPDDRIGAKAVLWGLEGESPLLGPACDVGGGVETDADSQLDVTSGDPQGDAGSPTSE